MSTDSMPLQERPCLSLQGSSSMMCQRTTKRRSRCGEGVEAELTPTELIQLCPPRHKRLCSRDKENECGAFVLARRSRRKKESSSAGVSWDHLPDELLLKLLLFLPLQELLRVSTVCKRWRRLVFDESLWHSVDLEGLTLGGAAALQQVLPLGVRRLRCPRCFVEDLVFTASSPLQMVQLDLSSSIIPTSALESIVCQCRMLEHLSLEGLQLSDAIINSLAMNVNLLQLNLSGCSGFSAAALARMLTSCCRMEQLNVSWCEFTSDHVRSVVAHLGAGVTQLNLSGYRESLSLDDVKVLVGRCPQIQTLDLSDSTLLMADSFPVLAQLKRLQHLSLSRCYHIHLAALTDLGKTFPLLGLLDVFGLVLDGHLPSLKKELPRVSINARPFSSVARPTPSSRPPGALGERTMWSGSCRLRFRPQ